MSVSFDQMYRAFEDKFRGSPESILERLRIYLPLLALLPKDIGEGRAIDIGCGRGEWLEIASEAGFTPVGVDLNAGMAQAALDKSFPVEIGDALEFLRRQEPASAAVISAFHVAEHLSVDYLLEVLNECYRVLDDGGLLIVETPNPENISVGTCTFHLDPTHQKPLPPVLLEFLVQESGFSRTAILRINGADVNEAAGAMEQAFQTMFETARDYACLALKQSDKVTADILSPFVAATSQGSPANLTILKDAVRKTETDVLLLREKTVEQIGAIIEELRELHLSEVASRDEIIAAHRADMDRLQQGVENAAAAHLAALSEFALKSETIAANRADMERLDLLQEGMDRAAAAHAQELAACKAELASRDKTVAELEAAISVHGLEIAKRDNRLAQILMARELDSRRAQEQECEIAALRSSTSWRVTAPLRAVSPVLRLLVRGPRYIARGMWAWITFKPGSRPRRVFRSAFVRTADFVSRRPRLLQLGTRAAAYLPTRLHQRLRLAALRSRGTSEGEVFPSMQSTAASPISGPSARKRRAAVVAPVSPAGIAGGAERLYAGLTSAIRDLGWEADLVTLPFDESSFETIKAGYASFEALDLDAYDLVISTKAPSYCVRHRNHALYLVHTIRVFYDMFESAFRDADERRLEERRWIHRKDNEAIGAIDRRYAIGEEVAQRLRSFNGLDARTLHPALKLERIVPGPIGDYFFMPGRLHRWKRVDLVIAAVRASHLPMKLIIAGTGEEEAALRSLAHGDERIVFAGYVDDADLANLYRQCLGVVFCPVREDYGYVTIEAFAYAKPVITCSDSGEPLQFVRDGETGLVCDPDLDAVRSAMERLWSNRGEARKLGLEGSDVARNITWERVARTLLGETAGDDFTNDPPKLKVAVLDMQPITPTVGGGRLRLHGLYHNLGERFETRYVGSYDWPGDQFRQQQLSGSLKEIVVPLSEAHHKAAEEAKRKAGGRVVIDMLFGVQGHLSMEYLDEAKRAVAWADIVIFSHPWVAPLIDDSALEGKFIVYDSQNVELDLREQLLNREDAFQSYVLDQVEQAERLVGDRAHLVLACSTEDAIRFNKKYDWLHSNVEVVPNGVFSQRIVPVDMEVKAALKRELGLPVDRCTAFFIGSDYMPNVEAVKIIIQRLAPSCPKILFVIAGGVCSQFTSRVPKNVRFAGHLSEADKIRWLNASDVAVNPMLSGSGTNIKMFDFAAAGLPIVATPVGARGIAESSSYGIEVCEPDAMVEALSRFALDPALRERAGVENRRLVENRFSWEMISPQLGHHLKRGVFRQRGRERLGSPSRAPIPVLHFSTVGQKCGIGEYTRQLMVEMGARGFDSIAFTCETPLARPDLSSIRGRASIAWFHDTVAYASTRLADDIEMLIAAADAEFAIVQHHPAFLGSHQLSKLVDLLVVCAGLPTAIVVHALSNEQIPLLKRLSEFGAIIVSHKREDLLTLSAQGLDALQLPLAIPSLPQRARKTSLRAGSDFTIASNGFLREHKGIEVIVDAFALLRQSLPEARLNLHCPLYPSEDSERACAAVIEAIARHQLEAVVKLDTAYKDKQALLEDLSDADVAVFAYGESAEGGSAAAADAVGAGLPVIVSPSRIFDDLRETALTCRADAESIAAALRDIHSDSALYRKLAIQSQTYADRNSWELVVDTLSGALLSSVGNRRVDAAAPGVPVDA